MNCHRQNRHCYIYCSATLRTFQNSANAVPACRSAFEENRVPEWKTGGAIFIDHPIHDSPDGGK
jgi:hypothetical protein